MKLNTIGIIIRREYLNRVQKKSFLVTTFLVPVLMAALVVVPIVLMMNTSDKTKKVAVIDQSGIVLPSLEPTKTLEFVNYGDFCADSIKAHLKDYGLDALLTLSPMDSLNCLTADLTSAKPLGFEVNEIIDNKVNAAIEDYRIASYDIPGLEKIMKDVKAKVKINAYTIDKEGNETISETGVYTVISMLMGIIIFLFITLFGAMVMSAVIEEKSSRVVEVLVSSVKATELMFGKIIGIALVALTQFILWILLTGILIAAAGTFVGFDSLSASALGAPGAGTGIPGMEAAPSELSVVISTLAGVPVAQYLLVFLLFFIFGYLLYSTLFAAVGSAVENEGDTQQLQMPLTIPLMIGYFIAIYTFKAPDSGIAFWGSMIPFTSPIVMLARLPFGVAGWEIAVSIAILLVTAVFCAWISAKIYKVGILMFGKKSTWRDLWKWLRQS